MNIRSQLELFLQAAGISDRAEREKILDATEVEILSRSYEDVKNKHTREEFEVLVKAKNEEIFGVLDQKTKEVLAELFQAGVAKATPEELDRMSALGEMLAPTIAAGK